VPNLRRNVDDGYASYVLAVLVLVYLFNFLDRQILSILAEDIRADLGLSDSSLGFLYGTAFAIFYAVFGIPLSRLADITVRKNVISGGLALWSAMTALSGTARGFGSLAFYRIGVGVGEASASPAAFSMLCDYFSPKLRATCCAIYSSGVYIGGGLGIFLGGVIVDRWNAAFPSGNAPFGLAGWQAAFMIVGLPGLLLALWVWTLREPVRGQSEGLEEQAIARSAARVFFIELASVLPLISLAALLRSGGRRADFLRNLIIAISTALVSAVLVRMTGSVAQWVGLGIGVYIFLTWVQTLALRDPAAFQMIYRSRAVVFGEIGFGWIGFFAYGFGFWQAPYFIRVHEASASEVGIFLGLGASIGGFLGATIGGFLSDWLKARTPRARPYMGIGTVLATLPFAIGLLVVDSVVAAYVMSFLYSVCAAGWIGSGVALANDLVLPRMRAAASAYYVLCITFVGLALGPYTIGRLSDVLSAESSPGDGLRGAMLLSLFAGLIAMIFLWVASRYVETEEHSRLDRARLLGEAV